MAELRNYRIQYLASRMLDGTARPERKLSGYFRHEIVVAAAHEQEALLNIMERGGVVLKINALQEKNALSRLFLGRISRSYKQKFLQALAFNVQAGLSPEKALEQVILGELGEARLILNRSLNALQQGFGFVESLEILQWFDDSTLAVLRAGEAAGRLSQALETAVGFYSRGSATIKLMFGAVSWTVLDIFMAVSTVIGMRFGLIEELKKNPILSEDPAKVQQFKDAVHLAQNVNDGLLIFSFLFILAILYLLLMLLSRNPEVRKQCYQILERIPLIRVLMVSSSLSNTMRVMSSLMSGGVAFLESLHISKRGAFSPSIKRFWDDVQARTEIGEPPSSAFNLLELESSERLLIRAHRDQAQLAECLESIALTREERANMAAKRFAVMAFVGSLLYSGVAVLFSLVVVYLQNQTVLSGA